MDSSTVALIVSVIVAIVAIVPGVWALVNQANKDKAQAKLDTITQTQTMTLGLIQPLKDEITRLQARIAELEADLQEKAQRINELEQVAFEKDSTIRNLQFNMDGMKLRLDEFEARRKRKPVAPPSPEEGEETQSEPESTDNKEG